ncbi:MAG: tRNA (adenosine(37)-N6)-dimethylallyltransferase MiaA [Bacteroidales bacterium]|nr:tRNA (adenosine(37)-N6)-dimethylallyltransferase MiaA [Bacteroidales bacterium]
MEKNPFDLITILGHTAGGKTAFAANLAFGVGGEIISADSRQVYRGMDIGTGKDYADYMVENVQIPVHLVDLIKAGYEYNVYLFKHDFLGAYTDISDRNLIPILCGGTGLYIESVLRNYKMIDVPVNDPLRADLELKSFEELKGILRLYGPLHNVTDTGNRKRMIRAIEIGMFQATQPEEDEKERELNPIILGIRFERTMRRKRITDRLRERLENGMVEEVERLMAEGVSAEKMEYYGLEYKWVSKYILKELTYEDMFNKLNTAIHQFAKRQMTYFRGMERRGLTIHWIEGQLPMEDKVALARKIIKR